MRAADALAVRCRVELDPTDDDAGLGTVILRLSDADGLNVLKAALARREGNDGRYLLQLVKIDATRSALDGDRRRHLEEALRARSPAEGLARLMREPAFWSYLEEIDLAVADGEVDAHHARMYVYRVCRVECARDLENDPQARERYQALVVAPFRSWLDAR